MARSTRVVSLSLAPALVERLDLARGSVSRSAWFAGLLEREFGLGQETASEGGFGSGGGRAVRDLAGSTGSSRVPAWAPNPRQAALNKAKGLS